MYSQSCFFFAFNMRIFIWWWHNNTMSPLLFVTSKKSLKEQLVHYRNLFWFKLLFSLNRFMALCWTLSGLHSESFALLSSFKLHFLSSCYLCGLQQSSIPKLVKTETKQYNKIMSYLCLCGTENVTESFQWVFMRIVTSDIVDIGKWV